MKLFSPRRARRLQPGSRLALVAPSFGFDRDSFESGCAHLTERYELQSCHLPSVFERESYFAGSDDRRASELVHWLRSADCDGVLAIRGGYGMSRILPRVLKELRSTRRLRPKIFVGYSDLTLLLNLLHQKFGWVTFHGPVLTGRPFHSPTTLEAETFRASLFSAAPLGMVSTPATVPLVAGQAEGRIVGGCMSLIVSSLGTPYEIKTRGKVLFLEDVDERPYRLDRMLTQLLHAGMLDHVKAIVFGQLAHCEPSPVSRDPSQTTARQAIEQAIGAFARAKRIPVLLDWPAGHGTEQVTFPIGARVRVLAEHGLAGVEFLEPGVT